MLALQLPSGKEVNRTDAWGLKHFVSLERDANVFHNESACALASQKNGRGGCLSIPAFNFSRLVARVHRNLLLVNGASRSGSLLMKMDIEAHEFSVLPPLQ